MKLGGGTGRVKRGPIVLMVLVAGAALAAYLGRGHPGEPPPGAQGRPGFSVYTEHCAGCHGDDGVSGRASRIKKEPVSFLDPVWADTVSLAWLDRVTRVGKGRMRGLGRKLTDAEVREVSAYVKWMSTAPPYADPNDR